jgi:hypothetical protein
MAFTHAAVVDKKNRSRYFELASNSRTGINPKI